MAAVLRALVLAPNSVEVPAQGVYLGVYLGVYDTHSYLWTREDMLKSAQHPYGISDCRYLLQNE